MRFTTRDVLWLTVVVALAAGWYVDRNRAEKQRAHAASVHAATKKELAELTGYWNNIAHLLKANGVTINPYANMIYWKGEQFPVDFKAPVDPTAGEIARGRGRTRWTSDEFLSGRAEVEITHGGVIYVLRTAKKHKELELVSKADEQPNPN